jgi:hypothetical protein
MCQQLLLLLGDGKRPRQQHSMASLSLTPMGCLDHTVLHTLLCLVTIDHSTANATALATV